MKQLLLLLLFPCFALAQYQGNSNQKITLGEQTTADGLVWRGRLADTANLLTNKLDTSVYIVLDTGTRAMWYYRVSTTPKWTRLVDSLNNLQGQLSLTSKVTGTLPVANGGTGATSLSPNNYLIRTNSSGIFDTAAIFEAGGNVGIGTTTDAGYKLDVNGTGRFSGITTFGSTGGSGLRVYGGSGTNQWDIYLNSTNLRFSDNTGTGSVVFDRPLSGTSATINNLSGTGDRNVIADANGLLSAPTSSIMTKENVQVLNYGLNEILQINPVSFDYIDKNKWGEERKLGFIVEDMYPIVPEVTGTMNNGDMYLDMVKLIPVLTKAIQEQQALIKALEQRIINLENK